MSNNLRAVVRVMVIVVMAVCFFAGCTDRVEKRKTGKITVMDDMGRKVTIFENPSRIISLSPSNTEILFALQLEEKIVGVTEFCDYPPEAKTKQKVEGFQNPNVETIVSLNPDLILADSLSGKERVEILEDYGIPVVVLNPKSVRDVLEDIKLIGNITDRRDEAEQLTDFMEKKIQEAADKTRNCQRPKVFYLLEVQGGFWTAGSGAIIDELIYLAGGENIASTSNIKGWGIYNLEDIIKNDPDIIIISSHSGVTSEQLSKRDEWNRISAIANNRVYTPYDENILLRPGPRLVEGLEWLESILIGKG